MTAFLAQGYKYKEIGNYGVGADAIVTMADAEAVIGAASDFLAHIEVLLA